MPLEPSIQAVIGSVTPPGRLRRAVVEAVGRRSPADAEQVIDLAERHLPFADGTDPRQLPEDTRSVIAAVSAADAVLLASPVYRGTFTGALKNLLDLLPVEALNAKPVAIVAMGASDHHYLGVDWHLRDVLAWFGALVVPTSVYLSARDFEAGVPGPRAARALDELLGSLAALAAAHRGQQLGPPPLASAAARGSPGG